MILFLDFDGVLHPNQVYLEHGRPVLRAEGHLFMWANILVDVLVHYTDVDIVLSTSWVPCLSYDRACQSLPSALGERVVGATWHSCAGHWDWSALTRYQQIQRYLKGKDDCEWLAIDDDDRGWPDYDRGKLIWTHPDSGISDPAVLKMLIERLER